MNNKYNGPKIDIKYDLYLGKFILFNSPKDTAQDVSNERENVVESERLYPRTKSIPDILMTPPNIQ